MSGKVTVLSELIGDSSAGGYLIWLAYLCEKEERTYKEKKIERLMQEDMDQFQQDCTIS